MRSTSHPKVKLSALREIGWTYWDPIGIRDMVSDDYSQGHADEYDSYLRTAFVMLCNNRPEAEVVSYLDDIACNYMGLGPSGDNNALARKTTSKLTELMKSLT